MRGTRTGVFIGCSASESHEAWSYDAQDVVGYEMTGCTRSMFANRLSYYFDFKGMFRFDFEVVCIVNIHSVMTAYGYNFLAGRVALLQRYYCILKLFVRTVHACTNYNKTSYNYRCMM